MTRLARPRLSTVLLALLALVVVPGRVDAAECDQVKRRHLSRAMGSAMAAGHGEHRRGMEPRAARRRAGELGVRDGDDRGRRPGLRSRQLIRSPACGRPGGPCCSSLVLAPLIIPTEVLIVPLFAMFRTLGLINSLPGLAITNVVAYVSFATLILVGYFRTIPRDVTDAAGVDGAGRLDVLLRIVIPLARPGILAVAVLVAVLAWNDFSASLVLLQKPDTFTVQLALTRFSTFYATDQGLTFAGMAIVILPPLLLFLVLQRSLIQGLAAGMVRH